jgi:hypothetical protein
MKSNWAAAQSLKVSDPGRVVQSRLTVVVPFTTPELTKVALSHAVTLSTDLNAAIRLIETEVVPVQYPLDEPPISREFSANRLSEIAAAAGIHPRGEIIYTRDFMACFRRKVHIGSLIVIAEGMSWWPTAEKKLARKLLKAGYDVVLVRAHGSAL